MKSFYRLLLICFLITLVPSFAIAEEPVQLRVERLSSHSPDNGWYVGEAVAEAQRCGDRKLRVLPGVETDIRDNLNRDLSGDPKEDTFIYGVENYPQIYVLHGFSGNGADDLRGMKISRAVMERVGDENQINIEVEVPNTTYVPFGGVVGTCDVRYMNYRVFLDGLPPGKYKVNCVKKIVHIECKGGRRNPAVDKVIKTEMNPVKTFDLHLN